MIRQLIFLSLMASALMVNFQTDLLRSPKPFHSNLRDVYSESLVIGRLVASEEDGLTSHNMFLLQKGVSPAERKRLSEVAILEGDWEPIFDLFRSQYERIASDAPTLNQDVAVYKSQNGFQGLVFGIIDWGIRSLGLKGNIHELCEVLWSVPFLIWFAMTVGYFASRPFAKLFDRFDTFMGVRVASRH